MINEEWKDKQYLCNQTNREKIFIGLDMILTAGDRIEYNYDRKTDIEIKQAIIKYADVLTERASELLWLATNIMTYDDKSEESEDAAMIDKLLLDFDER